MRKYLLLILIVGFLLYSKESISISVYSPPYQIKKIGQYDCILTEDEDHLLEPGVPEVPVCREKILLPLNATIINLRVRSIQQETLSGYYHLPPVQKPAILSNIKFEPPERVNENQDIYNLMHPYPEQIARITGTGNLRGMKTVDIIFHPFQWIPKKGILVYNKRIDLEIEYIPEGGPPRIGFSRIDSRIRQTFFTNSPEEGYRLEKNGAGIDYLIITHSSFVDEFAPLVEWKRQKGLKTMIVTTDSIYSNYSGIDNQERIRNFLKDMFLNYGLIWVLIGGDTDIIPSRIAYAMDSEAGFQPSNEDSIHADLYYSDLDGDWNYNGLPPYGEIGDSVDLYPDVFVGRAPVDTEGEVSTFVNKIIIYEKNPPVDYLNKALFLGEILWWNPYTDAGVGKNMIDSLYVPDWINITKLYQSLGNENPETVRDSINNGQNLINHDGHAWYTVMGMGDGYFGYSDMDNLTNGDSLSILYSIGCWANAFDYDAISEHFINNPNGGGVAFIGNSRYGWGSPGHPGFGYSDRFDAKFFSSLFEENYTNIGFAIAMTKADYIPRSRQENVYRIHQYQLNLLGDPEMPVWLGQPGNMEIAAPDTIQGNTSFRLRITDTENIPLKGARVCITQINNDSIWERSYTDECGETEFDIAYQTPDSLLVTATLDGYLPIQDTIIISPSGPYLSYIQSEINDTYGNNDGIINPGEEIELEVTMQNTGDEIINNVDILLQTSDSLIEITDSLYSYPGTLEVDSTFQCTFSLLVDSLITSQHPLNLQLIATSPPHSWVSVLSRMVGTPDLLIVPVQFSVYGSDSIPNGGDTCVFHYRIENNGYGNGYGIEITFSSTDSYISFGDSTFNIDTLLVGEQVEESLSIYIANGIPEPHLCWFYSDITTSDSFVFADSFSLKVGETGFYDDLESGTINWEHYGTNDLWHLSDYRSYSGNYSFYCGNAGTHQYIDSMEAVLRTESFAIFSPCSLSFYHWYEFTNYGTDGLLLIIEHNSVMDTLDFIGSGGALDSTLNIGNSWLKDGYDLSYIESGSIIRLYFVFTSDNSDQAEGIYIDDIWVTGSFLSHIVSDTSLPEWSVLSLSSNPIYRSGQAFITLRENNVISLDLFDRCGRLIEKIIDRENYQRGTTPVNLPVNIPSGIYFLHLKGNHISEIKKLVIFR